MFEKILVAVDGSEHGLKAAQAAGEMARQHKSELWVVVAYDVLPKYLGEPNLSGSDQSASEPFGRNLRCCNPGNREGAPPAEQGNPRRTGG